VPLKTEKRTQEPKESESEGQSASSKKAPNQQ